MLNKFSMCIGTIIFFSSQAALPSSRTNRSIPTLKEQSVAVITQKVRLCEKSTVEQIWQNPVFPYDLPEQLADTIAQHSIKDHAILQWFNQQLAKKPLESSYTLKPEPIPFSLAIDEEENHLLVGSTFCSIATFDLGDSCKHLKTMPTQNAVRKIFLTPELIFTSGKNVEEPIHIYNKNENPEFEKIIGNSSIFAIAHNKVMNVFAIGTEYGKVILWNARTNKLIHDFGTVHTNWILDVAFSPDGKFLASASNDMHLKIWDLETNALIIDIQIPQPVNCIAFSPDKKYFVVGSGNYEIVYEYDKITNQTIANNNFLSLYKNPDAIITTLTFNATGSMLASGWSDGDIRISHPDFVDTKTTRYCARNCEFGHTQSINNILFIGKNILSTSQDGSMRYWETSFYSPEECTFNNILIISAAYYAFKNKQPSIIHHQEIAQHFGNLPNHWKKVLSNYVQIDKSLIPHTVLDA